jgi:two-component SAPR family response regulator
MNKSLLYNWHKVLIIDEDPLESSRCEKIIKLGYLAEEIVCANSVSKAIAFLIKEHGRQKRLPEIIFLNISRHNSNSLKFIDDLESYFSPEVRKNLKIVLLTKESPEAYEVTQAGFHKILTKPFTLSQVRELSS